MVICLDALAKNKDLEGRYRGYLVPHHTRYKFPLQIDFYKNQDDKYSAILRLNLGSYHSHEYISQFYQEISYSKDANSVQIASDGWDIVLSNLVLSDKTLEGNFASTSGHENGYVILRKLDRFLKINPSQRTEQHMFSQLERIKTFPLVTGQYEGECGGQKVYLQLEASKWFSIIEPIQTPFYGYKFSGRLARENQLCEAHAPCLVNSYFDGTFNPFTGSLKLKGQPHDAQMKFEYPYLKIDACVLENTKPLNILEDRNNEEQRSKNLQTLYQSSSTEHASIHTTLTRSYKGLLFHDQRNTFQSMDMHVRLLKHEGNKAFSYILPQVVLRLNQKNSMNDLLEYMTFSFHKIPLTTNMQLSALELSSHVSTNIWDSGSDLILKVSRFDGQEISGLWISKTFGIVGPFRVLANEADSPLGLAQKDLYQNIFGHYDGASWSLRLGGLEDRTPLDIAIFFPFQLTGEASIAGLTEKKSIRNGVYDMYSSAIAFRLSDQRLILGRSEHQKLQLFVPSYPKWGVKMNPMELVTFQLKDPSSVLK